MDITRESCLALLRLIVITTNLHLYVTPLASLHSATSCIEGTALENQPVSISRTLPLSLYSKNVAT